MTFQEPSLFLVTASLPSVLARAYASRLSTDDDHHMCVEGQRWTRILHSHSFSTGKTGVPLRSTPPLGNQGTMMGIEKIAVCVSSIAPESTPSLRGTAPEDLGFQQTLT